jgi:lia operon protein LiaG
MKSETFEAIANSGGVALTDVITKQALMKTDSGDIIADFMQSEHSDISSSSGDINIRSLTGKGKIHTKSGDLTVKNKELLHNLDISSSSGDVSLSFVTAPAAMVLDFSSNSGTSHINANQLNYDTKTEHNIRASIGSGGPSVKIGTKSGDFSLDIH